MRQSCLFVGCVMFALTSCGTPEPDQPGAEPAGRIAFVVTREAGNADLALVDTDGNRREWLTDTPEPELNPAWSPDGTRIAYSCASQVHMMNADGSGQTRLTDLPGREVNSIKWAPDGRRLLFFGVDDDLTGTLYLIGADGSDLRVVGGAVDADWGPDSTRIVVLESGLTSYDTYIMQADGSNRRLLAHGGFAVGWSPR